MKRIIAALMVLAIVSNVAFAASNPGGDRMSVGDDDTNNKQRLLRYRHRARRERNAMIEEESPYDTAERNLSVFTRVWNEGPPPPSPPENSFRHEGRGGGGYSSYRGDNYNYGSNSGGGGGYSGKGSAFPDWTDPPNVIKRAWNAPNLSPSLVTPPPSTVEPSDAPSFNGIPAVPTALPVTPPPTTSPATPPPTPSPATAPPTPLPATPPPTPSPATPLPTPLPATPPPTPSATPPPTPLPATPPPTPSPATPPPTRSSATPPPAPSPIGTAPPLSSPPTPPPPTVEIPAVSSSPSSTPSDSPSSSPSASPSKDPSSDPTRSPIVSPSSNPSAEPTLSQQPSLDPTTSAEPSFKPSISIKPTFTPQPTVSEAPSTSPTKSAEPSSSPSDEPSASPIKSPPSEPSSSPSTKPSLEPSASPSKRPSREPSISPTDVPNSSPSAKPSREPSVSPSDEPTSPPLSSPTGRPSLSPSSSPSKTPSSSPSSEPSRSPSSEPSLSPSRQPSSSPSAAPTCDLQDCTITFAINADSSDDTVIATRNFDLELVTFIRNVQVDIATTWGGGLRIELIAPNDDVYFLMYDSEAIGGVIGANRRAFDMGLVAGDGSLLNVAPYTFVETGGITGFTAPYSEPRTYNAEGWNEGPYGSGKWTLRISDTVQSRPSSIGDMSINYCGICVDSPSASPSSSPSSMPSRSPSRSPSASPSAVPSEEPTNTPKPSLSFEPSESPTLSTEPSLEPSAAPSLCVECEYVITVNNSVTVGVLVDRNFTLNDVTSINSIEVEVATTYGYDLFMRLTPPTTDDRFVLMDDTIATRGIAGVDLRSFDMGENDINDGSLSNVGNYMFVESGGEPGFISPYSPPATYNAEAWGSNSYPAGTWNLFIDDFALDYITSVRIVKLKYCGACSIISPSSQPSSSPSSQPSNSPSNEPSLSSEPSHQPSLSLEPSSPSSEPSRSPSSEPSLSPSRQPSSSPSAAPSCDLQECTITFAINADSSGDNVIATRNFDLKIVTFIRNVQVDIATTWGRDLRIELIAPNDDVYFLMYDSEAIGGVIGANRRAFDMGLVAGDGSLLNVAPYIFVETGGITGFTAPYSEPRTYNAEVWNEGPYGSGEWTLRIRDTVQSRPSSIGDVSVNYCGICVDSPSALSPASPSSSPSSMPSRSPSWSPSASPSAVPSEEPTNTPKPSLSFEPSESPTLSAEPSLEPSAAPSLCVECEYVITVNNSVTVGVLVNRNFTLNDVTSINSIEVEVATTYGYDLFMRLMPPTTDDKFVLMDDTIATRGIAGVDLRSFGMGDTGNDGSLLNIAKYTFVESGGESGFISPYSPPATYNAEGWGSNSYPAGTWNLFIDDSALGDITSIGIVKIKYCGVCSSISPSSQPSNSPSNEPSLSSAPSSQPSLSSKPSARPSDQQSVSFEPSDDPSNEPSNAPSKSATPSSAPSVSQQPSETPSLSLAPSESPSDEPSKSLQPSSSPSKEPSSMPSNDPSSIGPSKSLAPSEEPSLAPSDEPSNVPSLSPSEQPSTQSPNGIVVLPAARTRK